MNFTPYHAKYFAYELTKRSSSDSIQKLAATLLDAQVDLNPHQVEAALFAFRSPLSKGAVLADEVGLGKTIEAALVISQKWAERKRRILVITPANLRKQWSQELLDKFFLPSMIMETRSFNEAIKARNLNPFDNKVIVICSYQFARSKEAYIQSVPWDLVVIDEAHRLRNVYKSSNKIGKSIKKALEHAPKILLTATPLQNSLLELYGLVSIIDDYAFGDIKSFRAQYSRANSTPDEQVFQELKERLKPVCKRTLRRQVLEYIKYTNRIALVEEFYPTPEEQRLYDLVSDYLQRGNLYALPTSQRQLMTLILRRLLASSTFAISGTLSVLAGRLSKAVLNGCPTEAFGHDKKGSVSFPQAVGGNPLPTLSFPQAVGGNPEVLNETISQDFETYDELKDEWEEDGEEAGEEPKYTEYDIENMKAEISSLNEFEKLAKSINKNSKGEKLITALERGFTELERLGAKRKAIIFTESTRTQEYLRKTLEERGYAGKVVLFNGSNNDPKSRVINKNWIERHAGTDRVSGSKTADMRAAIVDYFREDATVMIATEAAAEGINLQFCSLVVNYDLPWNPQRIEQRIGRCHRYGQEFDVVVVNFLNKANAADQRVYQLLNEKFNLFNGVFGSSDEVLGSIESGVDFEKRIARIYQECRTSEQIETAFNELQSELEGQISDTMKQTRTQLLENFDEEVHEKLRINLEESKAYLSKYENWLWSITRFYLGNYATFLDGQTAFILKENPFPILSSPNASIGDPDFTDPKNNGFPTTPSGMTSIIPLGLYRLGRNVEDAHIYRISHPLAQRIIMKCKEDKLAEKEVVFDFTGSGKKISILEPLVGKSGYLSLTSLSIDALELEDYLIFSGITEEGIALDEEQAQRLFSLSGECNGSGITIKKRDMLQGLLEARESRIFEGISARNSRFFDEEMEKLEKWADDMKSGLEFELKEIDREIKSLKTESKKILKLEEKLKAQREIKELEKRRNTKRRNLFDAQDEIERRKEGLLESVETRLKQKIETQELFAIKWRLV